jgi:hypothetical protein
MGRNWRALVERFLPWYDPALERLRNAHTEAIRRRSIATRIRAEHIVDDYRIADQVVRRKH